MDPTDSDSEQWKATMFNYGFISVQQNVSRLVLIDFYITGDIGSTTTLLLYY